MESYWAVAQTVSRMEHIVRREIEKANHGAFLPTCVRHRKVDGVQFSNERPVLGGYVFFLTGSEDWAGIPDIHGVYRVLANPNRTAKRVADDEMKRLVLGHACGAHDETMAPRYTKYYRPEPTRKRKVRKARPGKRLRKLTCA